MNISSVLLINGPSTNLTDSHNDDSQNIKKTDWDGYIISNIERCLPVIGTVCIATASWAGTGTSLIATAVAAALAYTSNPLSKVPKQRVYSDAVKELCNAKDNRHDYNRHDYDGIKKFIDAGNRDIEEFIKAGNRDIVLDELYNMDRDIVDYDVANVVHAQTFVALCIVIFSLDSFIYTAINHANDLLLDLLKWGIKYHPKLKLEENLPRFIIYALESDKAESDKSLTTLLSLAAEYKIPIPYLELATPANRLRLQQQLEKAMRNQNEKVENLLKEYNIPCQLSSDKEVLCSRITTHKGKRFTDKCRERCKKRTLTPNPQAESRAAKHNFNPYCGELWR